MAESTWLRIREFFPGRGADGALRRGVPDPEMSHNNHVRHYIRAQVPCFFFWSPFIVGQPDPY